MTAPFDIVILGLTITSSWGNGHATTWRGLIRGLAARGHRILFLERDAPWYAANRDEIHPEGATTVIYHGFDELTTCFESAVAEASLVIVGSYVPEGIRVGEWVTSVASGRAVFYDIDTPVTLERLETGDAEYISPGLIRRYDAYFSFTGGPTLRLIESRYGSPMARALYCSVDQEKYRPDRQAARWDLGYMGTYSSDRQPLMEELLLKPASHWPAGRFTVAGPQYPPTVKWPPNVERTAHLSPLEHVAFYGAQRFTLNITRYAMRQAGYSPSVRLFEAGACGVPVISDLWEGLDTFFRIGEEVLIAENADDTLRYLRDLPESKRLQLAISAHKRVLSEHTPGVRAQQVESYLKEMNDHSSVRSTRRNRCGGQNSSRMDARFLSERDGEAAGEESSSVPGAASASSDIYEPSRTGS